VVTPLLGGALIALGVEAGLIAADFVPALVVIAGADVGVILAFFAASILRAAEKNLIQSQLTLRQSQEDFARAQDVGQMGWWRLDVKRDVLTWSKMTYRIFDVPQGTPLSYEAFLARVHPEDRGEVEAQWNAALAGKPYDLEHRIVVGDKVKWIREKAYLEFDRDGLLLGGFGIAQDITDLKKAELALRESDRHKDAFLATLAHELRNPLAPIRNALLIFRRSGEVDRAKIQQVLPMMERQVDHLVRLVDDLLEVSRITTGKFELKLERCELMSLLREAIQASQPHIEARAHRLTVKLPSSSVFFECDPTRLVQVVVNLLNNAARYTPSEGNILLHAEIVGDEAIIRVPDDGIGIAKEAMAGMFELFTQATNIAGHARRGLGVGLFLSRTLVNLHGGSIEGHSEGANMGSEFVVRLPLRQSVVEEPKIETGTALSPVACRRVLVVDDEPDVGDSFGILLKALGMDVHIARGGREALEAIPALKPQLVFLDLGMPEIDGFETARLIRALPEGRDVVLYALSGWGREKDRRKAIEAGFDGHYVKPIGLDVLAGIIGAV
jgi:signal transduction histidine kinase/CheY-like chemotaxis protein